MSYLVLARKYRPRRFDDVTGQEVSTRVLQGAIEEGRVGHAYLFAGPRGTGKTTTARIFAKALNCAKGPALEPCLECERCEAAERGAEVDLVEIDAASNTGVDHIRELRDQVAYVPMQARYKIYLIDEVHMLSKGAFNALLKTLEEPPAHVKFLFATTELHKVPDTILSRCQVLRLSPLSEKQITARLTEVFARESVRAGPGVCEELARRARGGMRDALSLADQLLALVGDEPQLADLESMGGDAGLREIEELCQFLEAGDAAGALTSLPIATGSEEERLDGLLEHLRSCLLVKLCGPDSPHVEGGAEMRQRALARAERLGLERLENWLAELLGARERLRFCAGQERLVLELALLELARPAAGLPIAELIERLQSLEQRLGSAGQSEPSARSTAQVAAPKPVPAPAPGSGAPPSAVRAAASTPAAAAATASSAPGPAVSGAPATAASSGSALLPAALRPLSNPPRSQAEAWRQFLEELTRDKQAALAEILRTRGRLIDIGPTQALVRLDGANAAQLKSLEDKRNQALCARALSRVMGRELQWRLDGGADAPPGTSDAFTQRVANLFEGSVEDRA